MKLKTLIIILYHKINTKTLVTVLLNFIFKCNIITINKSEIIFNIYMMISENYI